MSTRYRIPDTTLYTIENYVGKGIPPGGFMEAVFCNNLKEAVAHADMWNQECLVDIVKFMYNKAPSGCWGSKENMLNWIEQGGLGKEVNYQEHCAL
jgi:hypothetical protein